MKNDALKFIGLLYSGKNLSIGDSAKELIKKGKAVLVLIANDISDNSKKEIDNLVANKNIKIVTFASKIELANAVGKGNVVVMATSSIKASNKLCLLIKEEN